MPDPWPLNRNHEAARRHVDQHLRDRGLQDYSRRETHIATLLDDLTSELHELRAKVYPRLPERRMRTGVSGPDLYRPHLLKRATVLYGPLEVTLWRVICWNRPTDGKHERPDA